MDQPRFTSNLDDDDAQTLKAALDRHAASNARAQLYTTVTGLTTVLLVVAIVVAPAVVVAAYRWAF